MATKKVTIKDVAREAGVSISTVSNAINNVDVLLPETKEHVLEVARRLHYVPNLNGRNLKAQETKSIGLFITAIRGPYYSALADSVYQGCRNKGYDLHIVISDSSQTLLTNILGKRIDGAVILNEHVGEEEIAIIKENEFPTVFIDREIETDTIGSVVFDSYHEGELAAKYLLELGHKRLMYIKGLERNFDSLERARGFLTVAQNSGCKVQEEYQLKGEFDHDISYNSVKEFLEKGLPLPEAVFASNDVSAIGVMEALLDEGIKVPEEVCVIGCDDIETASLVRPALTTIRTSFERQGTQATDQLISMIKERAKGQKTILNGRIIPRESTCMRE